MNFSRRIFVDLRTASKGLVKRIHWYWLPPFLVLFLAMWQRQGPIVAIGLALAGLLLGVSIEVRDQRRRSRGPAQGPTDFPGR